jgi:hypothetical protein
MVKNICLWNGEWVITFMEAVSQITTYSKKRKEHFYDYR